MNAFAFKTAILNSATSSPRWTLRPSFHPKGIWLDIIGRLAIRTEMVNVDGRQARFHRIRYDHWSVATCFRFNVNLMDQATLIELMNTAGSSEGIMEDRRQGFGRFHIADYALVEG